MARHRLTGLLVALALTVGGVAAANAGASTIIAPIIGGAPGTLSPCYGSANLTFIRAPIVTSVDPIYRVHDSIGLMCTYSSSIVTTCYSATYDVLGGRIGYTSSEGVNACNASESSATTYPIGTYVRQTFGFTMTLTTPGATWGGPGNGFCTNGPPNVATCGGEQEGIAPFKHSTSFG
jgi:hypothetical protein